MGIIVALLVGALGLNIVFPDLVASMINLLPAGGVLPPVVHTSAQYFGHALRSVDFIFPVSDLVTILWISYNVTLGLLVFYFCRYVVQLARGVNTNKFLG